MEAEQQPDQAPPGQQEAQQPAVANLQLQILQTIKAAQLQNGLKHGDYARYRQYCARRLRSLYKATKFLHGKGRYQKKKLDVQHVTDVRHLHIVLVSAERAWAHAMQLKAEAEAEGDGAPAPAKRRRALRRLKKASAWAKQLARLAGGVCDTRGSLEAEGYASWMAGNALMEGEGHWDAALAAFTRSKKLFTELCRVGDPDSSALWGGMLADLEPALRFCSYQMRRAGGDAPDPEAALAQIGSGSWSFGEGGEAGGGGLLQSKLASLAAEAQTAQAAGTSSFEWRGLQASLPLEKLRVPLHAAGEIAASLAGAMDTDAPGGGDDVLPRHDKLINLYSEARSAARSSIKAAAAGATAGGARPESAAEAGTDPEELGRLETALTGAMLEASLARGEAAAAAAAARFGSALARAAAGTKAERPTGKEGRPSKPEDLVRLYTTLSQHAHELEEHSSHMGGRAAEALAAAAAARGAAYVAWRAYYAGHAALAAGGGERWAEAAGLMRRAQQRGAAAVEAIQELPKGEAACWALLPGLQALDGAARSYQLVAAAEAAAEGAAGAEGVAQGLQGLGLQQQQAAAPSAASLLDGLDSWESFAGSGPAAKGARLAAGPYALRPLPARPIMLDSAGQEVEYPDVSHRCTRRAVQSQSTFARLWRGWGS